MIVNDQRMNIPETTRGITSVTISRTSSLKESCRPVIKESNATNDGGAFLMNKRSLSSEKMSSDSMVPVFLYKRGSSLRQTGKTAFPISSPNSNNHHAFKIIKPIETSPRTSECNLDSETISTVKVASRLKLKHRTQIPSQGGPLIPDHNLMKEPPKDSITFTPRPPLVKRFSSDQDETTSDIDSSQTMKSSRFFQMHPSTSAPRPPISPTRGVVQTPRSVTTNNGVDKNDKVTEIMDEDTSEIEDILNSDCETPSPSNDQVEDSKDIKYRSSLRKGLDSPNQFDVQGSPSPTKTVKWNLNTEIKKIPRSRSLNGKYKSSKSKSHKSANDKNNKNLETIMNEQKLVECHESYISQCTNLIRHQVTLLENIRHNKVSIRHYKKDLTELLTFQKKLTENLQNSFSEVVPEEEKPLDT